MCIDNDIGNDIEFQKLAKCMANQAHSVHIVPYIFNDTVLLDTPLYLSTTGLFWMKGYPSAQAVHCPTLQCIIITKLVQCSAKEIWCS